MPRAPCTASSRNTPRPESSSGRRAGQGAGGHGSSQDARGGGGGGTGTTGLGGGGAHRAPVCEPANDSLRRRGGGIRFPIARGRPGRSQPIRAGVVLNWLLSRKRCGGDGLVPVLGECGARAGLLSLRGLGGGADAPDPFSRSGRTPSPARSWRTQLGRAPLPVRAWVGRAGASLRNSFESLHLSGLGSPSPRRSLAGS